jgi:primase-polymerase (primpol)-like protein
MKPPERHWDTIPSALTIRPQWVGWCYQGHKKAPVEPSGLPASSTNPATWATFEHVQCAYYSRNFDGIGFVLTTGSGLTCLDFDDCLIDGVIKEPIARYVALLATYTEVTPGGKGLHSWLFGKPPTADCRVPGVEVYANQRFITVTGRHFPGTPMSIRSRQRELELVHAEVFRERIAARLAARQPQLCRPSAPIADDERLLTLARNAANGARFVRLFDAGQWQAEFPSQSEADCWLVSRLLFWTRGDTARADRLFRQSALMRPKWLREDYRARTLRLAQGNA